VRERRVTRAPGTTDGCAELLALLVACDSTNPSLVPGGAGESAVAALVAQRLEAAGLAVEMWDASSGRQSVLGVLKGTGRGRSLLLCSHLEWSEPTASCSSPWSGAAECMGAARAI